MIDRHSARQITLQINIEERDIKFPNRQKNQVTPPNPPPQSPKIPRNNPREKCPPPTGPEAKFPLSPDRAPGQHTHNMAQTNDGAKKERTKERDCTLEKHHKTTIQNRLLLALKYTRVPEHHVWLYPQEDTDTSSAGTASPRRPLSTDVETQRGQAVLTLSPETSGNQNTLIPAALYKVPRH